MARKMAQGGLVTQRAGDTDEEEMEQESERSKDTCVYAQSLLGSVEANIEEYITMVAAGLTGTTPHMISASINALSRLLFEFKGESGFKQFLFYFTLKLV